MSTNYELIFDKFIKKLKGDSQFFNYSNLSESEINELVNDHLNSLLASAVDTIYEYGNPDIDFNDRDDILQQFNVELVPQEISLLSNIMFMHYSKEDMNKLKTFGLFFRSSEIELFSPANERKTTLVAINKLESNIVNQINNYYARDRRSWKLKSLYGGN